MSEQIELTIEQLGMLTEEVRRPEGPGDAPHTKAFNAAMVAAMRAGGGRAEGELGGLQLFILSTTGRRSGAVRENPVSYFVVDGGRIVMLASMGGADINPDWYHNVGANPQVEVEWFGQRFAAQAIALDGEERGRLFAEVRAGAPIFTEYQARTQRPIPVIELIAPEVDFSAVMDGDPWKAQPEQGVDGAEQAGPDRAADRAQGADAVYRRS